VRKNRNDFLEIAPSRSGSRQDFRQATNDLPPI
jgi:hypothetical protein